MQWLKKCLLLKTANLMGGKSDNEPYILCKILSFLIQHCTKCIYYSGLKFPEKANCAIPFPYSKLIFWIENDVHMLMRQ